MLEQHPVLVGPTPHSQRGLMCNTFTMAVLSRLKCNDVFFSGMLDKEHLFALISARPRLYWYARLLLRAPVMLLLVNDAILNIYLSK